ncbi:MAG TPA: 7-cyano-7-deazaguanine synthase QueC [Woeseiaceae bacterium]|nr:7-cyano-7-deazaguanine synthase QueC [Woeseiaceae bacterium]
MDNRALVVLSGGQDSTTCLYWAIDRFGSAGVESLTFDYGQRHRIELEAASKVAAHAGVPNVVLPIDTFEALGGSALTDPAVGVPQSPGNDALPATFVPGRNLVFLTFAAAYAWQRGIEQLVTGVAQTDYSGYPDCRRDTIDALEKTLALGLERRITIHTPLMNLTKKETVLLAKELNAIEAMALTHTCYNGVRPPCGECAACILRATGFAEAGLEDPLTAT